GLIKKIVKLNPTEIAAINRMNIAASAEQPLVTKEQPNNKVMTLEELKAQHPALYAQIHAEGKAAGVSEERERVTQWQNLRHIDAQSADSGIKEGKTVTPAVVTEFMAKALSPEALKKLAAEAAPPVTTVEFSEKEKTEKEKKISEFMDE